MFCSQAQAHILTTSILRNKISLHFFQLQLLNEGLGVKLSDFSVLKVEGYTPPQMEKGLTSNSIALESVFQKVPTRHCGLA